MKSEIDLNSLVSNLYASSFRDFVEAFWPVVRPEPFKGDYFVDVMCEHLQAVQTGQIKRLAIACPVRHGKSVLSSVFFPVWAWLHDPSLRILTASFSYDNAERDAMRSRSVITSTPFQKLFGSLFSLTTDQNVKRHYKNTKMGTRHSVGTGTATSGVDADWIIADDLLDYDHAKSEAERIAVHDYYSGTLSQRLTRGTGKDRIVLVGHRVHEDDVFEQVWKTYGNDGNWTYLVLPAEANPTLTNGYYNGLGWKDTREPGQPLCPKRIGMAELDDAKRTMRHKYHCLYNQDPMPRIGERFKSEWFRYYSEGDGYYNLNGQFLHKDDAWRFATSDSAVSQKKGSDYTVIQIWDVIGDNMILVDSFRKRLDGNQIVPFIQGVNRDYTPQFVGIELESVGKFIVDQLKGSNVLVRPFKSQRHGDKETRAVAAEIRLEARKVWFPANTSKGWVADLEREILAFPHAKHDDQVDCLSMACILADKYLGKLEPEKTPEQVAAEIKKKEEDRFLKIMNQSPFRWR